ncbi:MAG: permease-like cell division protein FtsX [Actinomycetota bacterium]
MATSTFVVALAVVVAVSIIVVGHRDNGQARAAAGSKEVVPAQMSLTDAIVVPASPEVEKILDALPLVVRYARIPRAYRGPANSLIGPAPVVRCALERSDGFAVQADAHGVDIVSALEAGLVGKAKIFDTSDTLGSDIRLFMKVGAASDAVGGPVKALRARLGSDAEISAFRFLSQAEAYVIFKRDFADQPALVESTKPSDIPASFRIDVKPGVSVDATATRYKQVDGVDTVITLNPILPSALFTPMLLGGTTTGASACAKG